MKHNNISTNLKDDGGTINLRAEVEKFLRHWKWFLVGIVVFVSLGYLYGRYSTPEYLATSSIMIKDNKKSGLSAELEAFKDLGIVGGGSVNNTDNEIEILKSRKVIGSVVDSLGLDVYYYVQGRVIKREVYRNSSPVRIEFASKNPLLSRRDTTFNIQIKDTATFDFLSEDGTFISSHQFGTTFESDLGEIKVSRQKESKSTEESANNVLVKIFPRYRIIDSYKKRIEISPVNKNSSVLILSLKDPVGRKAQDVLDELVRQYNLDAINDKNQVSKKTIDFINARIDTVGKLLSVIQDDVQKFKDDKNFTGLPAELKISLESLKETTKNIIDLKIQSSLAESIENKLKLEAFKYDLLPTALGIDNMVISNSIDKYNDLVLERNKTKESGAGERNPYLRDLENRIEGVRSSLLKSLSNVTASLELQYDELKKEEQIALSRVKSIPSNERGYIDIARRQEITSALYQYLLRKKEETDISLAVTVPNAKIIDVAYSSKTPVSPRKRIILLASVFLGLLIPFGIIYLSDLLDTKVHDKRDIESQLSVPFLGDIPKSDSKKKVIIGNDVRSSTAEAFRLIRTNLDFMLASHRKQSKSIFITSTTSGEGKSFVSINLAATLALSGKKVLLMGMDLRAPKVTEYLGIAERKGITNYITDEDMILEDLIFSIPEIKGLDIIASGVIPPNPAELLMTTRVENLFTIVKQEYDIVIVDTAPVNLVTDTLLIGKYADMFMYVVRANYLDKRLLAVPQELYNEQKLPNMAIVLNDTDPKRSYGYGYGGYGYGYVVVEKPWYKKIFSRKE